MECFLGAEGTIVLYAAIPASITKAIGPGEETEKRK